jgi:hypothetical protein
MNVLSKLGTLSILGLAIPAVSAGNGSASGTFKYNAKSYTASDAVAWHQDPFVKVVLSDKPFDRLAMAKDGRYDDSDLMAHPSASLTITIDAKNRNLVGIRLRDDAGSGADFRCDGPGLLTVTKSDAAVIAGKFKCEEHNVAFDAPLLDAAKP